MKKVIINTILIIVLALSITRCDSESEATATEISSNKELVLNKGEKWNMSAGITSRIMKMIAIVEATNINTFDPSEVSYKLHQEIQMMTSLCNIKGEAHNQLHNYIDPLTEQVLGLRIANDIAKVPLLQSIHIYLKTYNTYFN